MITDHEIKAADAIILYASMTGITADIISNNVSGNMTAVLNAARYLQEENFIEIVNSGGWPERYKIKAKGIDFQKSGKKYADYLKEKEEHTQKQLAKQSQDEYHKSLQIRDLETKLEVINKEQLRFWRRQKWHFWITVILGLLTLYNFFFK